MWIGQNFNWRDDGLSGGIKSGGSDLNNQIANPIIHHPVFWFNQNHLLGVMLNIMRVVNKNDLRVYTTP